MDPNATLRALANERTPRTLTAREAIADLAGWQRDRRTVRNAIEDLHVWLAGGGFSPDWARYPRGARRFNRAHGRPAWARLPVRGNGGAS
jgi:hypothetical protein